MHTANYTSDKQPVRRRYLKPWIIGLVSVVLTLNATAQEGGTTIIGTKEAPNVLNVVPWQERELSANPWDATPNLESQLLDESLKTIDQDELKREMDYYNRLQHAPDKRN